MYSHEMHKASCLCCRRKGPFTTVNIYIFVQSVLKGREGSRPAYNFVCQSMRNATPRGELLRNYYCFKSCKRLRRGVVIVNTVGHLGISQLRGKNYQQDSMEFFV